MNPCKECTRVKDPRNCGKKNCEDWRGWFLEEWEKLNNFYWKWHKGEKEDG